MKYYSRVKNGKNLPVVAKLPKDEWRDIFKVQRAVLRFMGYTYLDVMVRTRVMDISDTRHMLIWFMWKYTCMTKGDLAGYFQRDHTTIIYAISAFQRLIDTDDEMSERVKKIINMI